MERLIRVLMTRRQLFCPIRRAPELMESPAVTLLASTLTRRLLVDSFMTALLGPLCTLQMQTVRLPQTYRGLQLSDSSRTHHPRSTDFWWPSLSHRLSC